MGIYSSTFLGSPHLPIDIGNVWYDTYLIKVFNYQQPAQPAASSSQQQREGRVGGRSVGTYLINFTSAKKYFFRLE